MATISLATMMSLAQQAASKSEASANAAERDAEGGASQAYAEAVQREEQEKANIAQKAQGKQGAREFEKEAVKPLTLPQTTNGLMKGGEIVDPIAQLDLLQMLSKEEQDYAAVTYNLMSNARALS